MNELENRMSCKICSIDTFSSLEDFKKHRQSPEHLINLTKSLSFSNDDDQIPDLSNDYLESIKGSPFFKINYNDSSLQFFKILLCDRKDDLYSESCLDIDINLFEKLTDFKTKHVAIALNGGGYFAAAIIDNLNRTIICSKTFRRYTSRRKQGGSQSLKDNEKSGKINSAGAMIRRENEKKLREEINDLILTWKPHLDNCSVILCNRDPFLIQEAFKDYKVRGIPFTTYQADFEEICRCYSELISSFTIK